MDKQQQDCLVTKHADANNNNILAKTANIVVDGSSTTATPATLVPPEFNAAAIANTLSEKVMSSISKLNDLSIISGDYHHHHHTATANSVIQQSRNSKTLSIQNIYNHPSVHNDFTGQMVKSTCENANAQQQLVQILKPFYNSMQMLDKPPLISSENSSAFYVIDPERKLNLVDTQNQLSLLSQSNESYVHSLALLNSELLAQKKASPEFLYQNVSAYQPELPGTGVSNSYFNGYGGGGGLCSGESPAGSATSATAVSSSIATNSEPQSNKSIEQHLQQQHQIAPSSQNSSSTASNGTSTPNGAGRDGTTPVPVVSVPERSHTRGRKKSKKGPFICLECRKEFCNQSTLTKHMITHSDERKFVCPQCSKAFKRHDHLNGHMLTHQENKPYACDIDGCDKSYCDARSLRRHKEKHREGLFQDQVTVGSSSPSSSHKLPSLLTTDKVVPENLYLPVNASTHLQFLALQQKKIGQQKSDSSNDAGGAVDDDDDPDPEDSFPDVDREQPSSNNNGANNGNKQRQQQEILETSVHHHHQQQQQQHHHVHHHENALLHQLLTSQEKIFNSGSRQQQQNVGSNSNNNGSSTVIKINDNYVNVCNSLSENNYLQQQQQQNFNPGKNLNNDSDNGDKTEHPDSDHPVAGAVDKIAMIMRNEMAGQHGQDLGKSLVPSGTKQNELMFDCAVCLKKFPTLPMLNTHLKLHEEESKVAAAVAAAANSFLFAKSAALQTGNEEIKAASSHLPQTTESHLHPPSYEFTMKNFDLDMNKNYVYIEQQKEFDEINIGNDLEFRNDFHPVQQNDFGSSLALMASVDVAATKNDQVPQHLINVPGQIYHQDQPMFEQNKPDDNQMGHGGGSTGSGYENGVSQTKGLNEVMFSPITPVTPLNNNPKNTSQFTFEFATPQPDKEVEMCKSDVGQISYALDTDMSGNFCFEQEQKTDDLLQKNDIQLEPQQQTQQTQNFTMTNDELNQYSDPSNLIDSSQTHHHYFDNTEKNDCTFNSFDFPSKQLTSDLFHRRIRKNADLNKTKELLSIKQIAASLESFSQIYERSQQQQQQQHHLNHSYSVPTTPCIGGNMTGNTGDSTYMGNNNISHHSLPSTPLETTHFNFKSNNTGGIYQTQPEVHSMPNTPIETTHQHHQPQQQQQVNFIFPPETNQSQTSQGADDLMAGTGHGKNFDINCLNDANYSEYIYQATSGGSKDIPTEFIDENINNYKHPETDPSHHHNHQHQHHYNSTTIQDTTVQQNVSLCVTDLAENVNFYESTSGHLEFVTGATTDSDCNNKSLNSIMNAYIGEPVKDFNIELNNNDSNGKCHQNDTNILNNLPLVSCDPTTKEPERPTTVMVNSMLGPPVEMMNPNYLMPPEAHVQKIQPPPFNNNGTDPTYPRIKSPNFVKTLAKKLSSSINGNGATLKRKKPRPEPLYIPPHVNTYVYHSRLRSPRLWNVPKLVETKSISPPPYTPPPMLSPVRSGSGLFWNIKNQPYLANCFTSTASKFFNKKAIIDHQKEIHDSELKTPTTAYEPYEYDIPQTDIQPHVNIGPTFQARIPTCQVNRTKVKAKSDRATLLWNPAVLEETDAESLDLYLKIACSMCVPGHGNNKEYALHLLHHYQGDVYDALARLVDANRPLENNHPLATYQYADNDAWNQTEIDLFQKSILKHDKDFFLISKEIKTKTVKECIQFYYLWKKNSNNDLIKRLRFLRRKRESMFYSSNEFETNAKATKTNKELRTNECDDQQPNQSSNHLNNDHDDGHFFVSGDGQSATSSARTKTFYSCKICGKKFKTIKSRSTHMKMHGE